MAIIDGQGATFTFNGALVGGITEYNVIDGVTPDVEYTPLGTAERMPLPGVADFGSMTIKIYRDLNDAGQIEMETCRASSRKVVGVFTTSDGRAIQFPCYVKSLPIVGNDNGLGTALAVIKIAGKVTPA